MRADKATTLDLIERAYDAVATGNDWSEFLSAFAESLDAVVPGLFVLEIPGKAPILVRQNGLDRKWEEAFESHYVTVDVRRPLIERLTEGTSFRGQDVIADRDFVETEFYTDFLRPQNLFHIAGGIFLKRADQIGVVRVIRPRGAHPFGDRERRIIEPLLPHLKRAISLQQRLEASRDRSDLSEWILDRLATGIVLVDPARRVLWSNRKGNDFLAGQSGLSIGRTGRLVATHPEDDGALSKLIAAAGSDRGGFDCGGGALTLRREMGRRPLNAFVMAARGRMNAVGSSNARVAVLLTDPQESTETSVPVVQRHLGITAAEARLAIALANGRSVTEVAHDFGISVSTARTQLKRILAKTGVHRQAELVRLVLTGTAPLA